MKRFSRSAPSKRLKRKIFVAAEGEVTEREYVQILRDMGCDELHFVQPRRCKSSPGHVLLRMQEALKKDPLLLKEDGAWLLVDRDAWEESHMKRLFTWEKQDPRHHVVISNPCIELWLLLHFEDGAGATNAEICQARLKKVLPDYEDKHLSACSLTKEMIRSAAARAERLCKGKSWKDPGFTSFHRFIQALDIFSSSGRG